MNITGLILTYNEEANLSRTLAKLTWLPRVVIVDSGSDDGTKEIAKGFANISWYEREFDNHTNQWNYGLQDTEINTEWVLALDADYQISEELASEIQQVISQNPSENAFWMKFDYAIDGVTLKSGIYPPVRALYRKNFAKYTDDGHTQKLQITGETGDLKQKAIHDDRKSMKRWLTSQWNYASLEAGKLLASSKSTLSRQDKIRIRSKITPIIVFFYCILIRSGWKDGLKGWQYAWQRMIAEVLLQYRLSQERSKN